jgi:tetratricopeptide (TPR) repeat protein
MISVRKLMLGLGVLLLVPLFALTADFMFHHLRPKYGQLIIKTTPDGATIFVDGQLRGVTPLAVQAIPSGPHRIKVVKNGYKGHAQNIDVFQYATHSVRLTLEPLAPELPNKNLVELESWRAKLAQAVKARNFVTSAQDNALYCANKILQIDANDVYAESIRRKIGGSLKKVAESAYARKDWMRAEKLYKNMVLAFPGDASIVSRLAEITAANQARTVELADWTAKAEAAMKAGNLLPPEKDNAMDALRFIHQLETDSAYARTGTQRVKEMLRSRAEAKVAQHDWEGARQDFKIFLQYFPDDSHSQSRLEMLEGQLSEAAQSEPERAANSRTSTR